MHVEITGGVAVDVFKERQHAGACATSTGTGQHHAMLDYNDRP